MTSIEHRFLIVHASLHRILPQLEFPNDKNQPAIYRYYKYSSYFLRKEQGTQITRPKTFKGLTVAEEATWERILEDVSCEGDEVEMTYERFITSIRTLDELEPEEEFLRFYAIEEPHPFNTFVAHRALKESAVYGDTALRHWTALIVEISKSLKHVPLGLSVMSRFVRERGAPLRQNTRDLAKIDDCALTHMIPLFVEMCLAESFSEINILMRSIEEGIEHTSIAGMKFQLYDVVREFFKVILPHPKKVNNMLRAAYTWFVKNWGTGSDEMTILVSRASDDRNSKDVRYEGYRRERNVWAKMMRHSAFFRRSLHANQEKVQEAIDYANGICDVDIDMPIFKHLLRNTFRTEFNPRDMCHVLLASYLLSIQTIAGYGRAWAMNKSDDPEKILKDAPDNYVTRLREKTRDNILRLYKEAETHGHTIVQPEDMYTSLLRLAKNTSSGMSVEVDIRRVYGPNAERRVAFEKIKSRQKALVVFLQGDKIYSRENMLKAYNSKKSFQTKGSRDVPIKSTRTVYSIHIGILAPQLIMTLPLNEYVSKIGGITTRDQKKLGSKIIVGDLEATGSRVMDAADTFRNSSDLSVMTLAIDYADYDQHMSVQNFRSGMLDALKRVALEHGHLQYEGWTAMDMVEAGWGDGRIVNSKWLGNRKIYIASRKAFEELADDKKERVQGDPLSKAPPGTEIINDHRDVVAPRDASDATLLVANDGSDLAMISTHLSGENSTLVANSAHNAGIGEIMIEHVSEQQPGVIDVLSEQYVGDDTLMYLRVHTKDAHVFDELVSNVMNAIKLCGHEASESKTTFLPGSCEKTQTHAKQGIYIPQDRMMMISSERRKDIEDVQGYMRAQISTYITKVSRGFSEELAHLILMFKCSMVGYRKFKRTIYDGRYRNRTFYTSEDGMTLVRIRHPLTLYLPIDWNGFGGNPYALNIIMTPELFMDLSMMEDCRDITETLFSIVGRAEPLWNETGADTRQLSSESPMGLYTKLTRPMVRAALAAEELREQIDQLPLQGFGPYRLSKTMMRSAILKESRARTLLTSGYEESYQEKLNEWRPRTLYYAPGGQKREITGLYSKMFHLEIHEEDVVVRHHHPDVNLSKTFLSQKTILGNRTMRRQRMSYIDRIDNILRGDVVMRGFITANHIMGMLEELGTNHTLEDMSTIFQLMNISPRVSERLARYVCSERATFDTLMLAKGGVGGDEFSMSLDLLTDEKWDKMIDAPRILMKTEMDALALHASQLIMLRAAKGRSVTKMIFTNPEIHKLRVRNARIRARMMNRKTLNALCGTLRRLSTALVQCQ
uniref:VP1 n=1 Tax=Amate virus TaxID=2838393 RepID=A0A8E7DMG3_9VIRU|nr:VP1 [Amate virus]